MPISKLEVSVSDLTKRPRVQITQGDRRSRVIEATVTDGGSPMDLTGKRARFRAELPLGKVVIDDGCEVADAEAGVIRYTVGDEVAARAAVISNAYFEIYDEEGYSLAASKMVVEVGRGVDVDGERPSDYVPELDRLKAEFARIAEEAKGFETERASEFEAVKADAERATRAADEAASHQPRIGGDGIWEVWDAAAGAYADAGVSAGGVADIPLAATRAPGVVGIRTDGQYGLSIGEGNNLFVRNANTPEINSRQNEYKPITPNLLDYAVKAAMCDGKGSAWTAAEQAAAKKRMGISDSGGSSSDMPYIWVYSIDLAPSKDGLFTFRTADLTCIYPESYASDVPQINDIIFHKGYIYYEVIDSDSNNTICRSRERIV